MTPEAGSLKTALSTLKTSRVNLGPAQGRSGSPGPFSKIAKSNRQLEAEEAGRHLLATLEVAAPFAVLYEDILGPNPNPFWRYYSIHGGRGSGKSVGAADFRLAHSLVQKRRNLCAREFQSNIGDSVMSLLADRIHAHDLAKYFKIGKTSITSPYSGSEFKFAGLRLNIHGIKSFEGVDDCWVEEAQRVSEHSWKILIPTIRKEGSRFYLTWNPEEETDATSQRFLLHPPPNARVIRMNWYDNPWFPRVLEQERLYMQETDPDAYDWVWEGNFRKISDAVIFRGKFVIESFETPADVTMFYFGDDWGFASDPTAINRMWIRDNELFLDYEGHALGLELNDIPDLFDTVPLSRKYPIDADNSQPQTIKHVAKFGFNIRPAKKWPGSVEDGITYLRSFKKIHIHERCYYTAQEFRLYSYKVDQTSGNVLPVIVDKHNHHIDAIRYALGPRILSRRSLRLSNAQAQQLRRGFTRGPV